MALVSNGFKLVVTLIDSGANQSNLTYDLTAADYAAAVASTATIIARLIDVTNAVIKGYSIMEKFEEDALTLPGAGVHVEDRAVISMALVGSVSKVATAVIPAPKIGIFSAPTGKMSNVADVTDPELRAYAGIFGPAGFATISDGETVDTSAANLGVNGGKRTHRQSSRG